MDKKEFNHPELLDGEIFFTNATTKHFHKMNWLTKRIGVIAYDGQGKQLNHEDWLPIFLRKSELIQKGMIIREVRKSWREMR